MAYPLSVLIAGSTLLAASFVCHVWSVIRTQRDSILAERERRLYEPHNLLSRGPLMSDFR